MVLVEPIVFGRREMRETLTDAALTDHIELRRDGDLVYWDRIDLSGAIAEHLNKPSIAAGCAALATVLCAGPRAEAALQDVRDVLPDNGGASLVQPDLLSIRILAEDSFLLRRSLVPVLEVLTGADLPKSWSL
jgi:urease accessory protein